jgi:hypothetical protein
MPDRHVRHFTIYPMLARAPFRRLSGPAASEQLNSSIAEDEETDRGGLIVLSRSTSGKAKSISTDSAVFPSGDARLIP